MGEYDEAFDDVSTFLNFPNDSDDEDDSMSPPGQDQKSTVKGDMKDDSPLSPPASADDDAIEEDDLDDDDELYSTVPRRDPWKMGRDSETESPVNPRWLNANTPNMRSREGSSSVEHHPSPPTSDDAKTPSASHAPEQRRAVLETIQEKNETLIQTSANPKSSKSFPLLPDLLKLKTAEDEDEKMLASEEGRRLNPRERRQLRNKVSARNFRVRRKGMLFNLSCSNAEYIGHLETLVESQTQEIEQLKQSLNSMQIENAQLRQESGFLRSIALNQQQQQPQPAPSTEPMPHPNKDVNPNTFDWPLAYDGSQSPTQPNNNKFTDRPMYGGQVHAYGVRVPEVQFDKPHLASAPAPPLPTAPQYNPTSPRPQDQPQSTVPPGTEGYPHMLQAVTYLYDYIVKASGAGVQPQPPQPFNGYPMHNAYQPPPQQWGDAKIMGAPVLGYNNQYYNGNWGGGWNGGPPPGTA
jgi:hypothetical protein